MDKLNELYEVCRCAEKAYLDALEAYTEARKQYANTLNREFPETNEGNLVFDVT